MRISKALKKITPPQYKAVWEGKILKIVTFFAHLV